MILLTTYIDTLIWAIPTVPDNVTESIPPNTLAIITPELPRWTKCVGAWQNRKILSNITAVWNSSIMHTCLNINFIWTPLEDWNRWLFEISFIMHTCLNINFVWPPLRGLKKMITSTCIQFFQSWLSESNFYILTTQREKLVRTVITVGSSVTF